MFELCAFKTTTAPLICEYDCISEMETAKISPNKAVCKHSLTLRHQGIPIEIKIQLVMSDGHGSCLKFHLQYHSP